MFHLAYLGLMFGGSEDNAKVEEVRSLISSRPLISFQCSNCFPAGLLYDAYTKEMARP